MSRLTVHVSVAASTAPGDAYVAIREMQNYADECKCNVMAEVNGVMVTCSVKHDVQEAIQFYDRNYTRRGIRPVPNTNRSAS